MVYNLYRNGQMGWKRYEVSGDVVIKTTKSFTIDLHHPMTDEAVTEALSEKFQELVEEEFEGVDDIDTIVRDIF